MFGLSFDNIKAIAVTAEGDIYIGRGVFYVSRDVGRTWSRVSNVEGASRLIIIDSSGYAFAATSQGIFRSRDVVAGLDAHFMQSPSTCSLFQNYPNPFNPSTTIRYSLPSRSHVNLAVYNTLGQQVSRLQSSEQDAGYHEVKFDGGNLPSGVYFYRMQAGSYTETMRLLLMK